jgi:hypothetical protein
MKWIVGLVVAFALVSGTASAQTVTASWDPNTDAYTVGYRLYYGTASGSYQWMIDTGTEVSAPVSLSADLYFFAVLAYNSANEQGPSSAEATIDLRPAAPVDCQGTWSAWTTTNLTTCDNGQRIRTEQRTFTVTVQPANGGLACPTSPETLVSNEACTVQPPEFTVSVTFWPSSKKDSRPIQYTASTGIQVTKVVMDYRGQTVRGAWFTDNYMRTIYVAKQ